MKIFNMNNDTNVNVNVNASSNTNMDTDIEYCHLYNDNNNYETKFIEDVENPFSLTRRLSMELLPSERNDSFSYL